MLMLGANHCIGKTNIIYERYKLNNRSQIFVPRASVSFGHVVAKRRALLAAITGCP